MGVSNYKPNTRAPDPSLTQPTGLILQHRNYQHERLKSKTRHMPKQKPLNNQIFLPCTQP